MGESLNPDPLWEPADLYFRELTVPTRMGRTADLTDALESLSKCSEGWLVLETRDGTDVGVNAAHVGELGCTRFAATGLLADGQELSKAQRAQLLLLGWNPPEIGDTEEFWGDADISVESERRFLADFMERTLSCVFGVETGEKLTLELHLGEPREADGTEN